MPTELPIRSAAATGELTGRHVLIGIVSFFAVVFAVNFYFLRVALTTHTGVVANEPYRKGLKYNERIAAGEEQALLGWHDAIELSADGRELSVSMTGRSGEPVSGLVVEATLGRPATTSADRILTLEETAPGRYAAETGIGEPGGYIASLEASDPRKGDGVRYRVRKRLWLKQ